MNNITLIGRLTKELELRNYNGTTKQGVVGNGSIAVNREKDGTDFINFTVFDNTAKIISQYVKKGDLFAIDGSLRVDSYTDQQGQKKQKIYVLVKRVELLGTGTKNAENTQKQGSNQQNNNYNKNNYNNNTVIDNDLPF